MQHKQEEAKIKAKLDELEKSKPTRESFEPENKKLLDEAKATLGDYKLKSGDDYVVPENETINVSK